MLFKYTTYTALFAILLSSASGAFADSSSVNYNNGYDYDSDQFQLQKSSASDDEESEFARNGKDYYVYVGYVFSYHFNDKIPLTILASDLATRASIEPKKSLPNTFHTIEVGFGKEWGKHLDVQIAYLQQFEKMRNATITVLSPSTATSSSATIDEKGLSINFLYIFNPDDQIQVGAELGAVVMHINDQITANKLIYKLPDDNSTEIDPAFGVEFVFGITPDIAFRVSGQYIWHSGSKVSSGAVNALAGFSYII